ncbi:molybdenum cofactor guanylyltransferase MobA [Azovibrio restrictus]|uniref:molybdenum cofactor guanylyltransferase MobA n=1 Tax=Azovibrio restrictus TaxID=146938 RepID=UPI0026E96B0B|nr:molybdenum cofactor guanylyltransferase MobA [Azovibrio restrictus]MDD3484877.1 molybdenum cofactor guanylyltransferase [Azovibrio restrictus]
MPTPIADAEQSRPPITGLLLAGGQSRRMGHQDKGLQPLGDKPMAQWALERLAPQVDHLCISANQNLARYAALGAPYAAPVLPDRLPDHPGPLAGLHAALSQIRTSLLVSVPCDSPFLPSDLVSRLFLALQQSGSDLAVARCGERSHPVFCLCRRELLPGLEDFLLRGERKVSLWHGTLRVTEVPFDDRPEAFLNLNTEAELQAIRDSLGTPD